LYQKEKPPKPRDVARKTLNRVPNQIRKNMSRRLNPKKNGNNFSVHRVDQKKKAVTFLH